MLFEMTVLLTMKNVARSISLVTEVRLPRQARITKLSDAREKLQVIEDCEPSFILRINKIL